MASILVADADASVRWVLTLILCDAGHGVTVVGSVEEACTLLRQHCFDLVITDGFTSQPQAVLAESGTVRQTAAGTPVLLFTSFPVTKAEAMGAGFRGVVPKPFSLDALLAQVQEALTNTTPHE